MTNPVWRASAPSNIALIKYMGKIAGAGNRPTNASLSYTLEHLRTYVEIEAKPSGEDAWEPLSTWSEAQEALSIRAENWTAGVSVKKGRAPELAPLALSEKGRKRFLSHLQSLKAGWGFSGSFVVRSGNGFPSDCGLASSASSFAALTAAAAAALTELTGSGRPAPSDLAELSRRGSGSSCRSFFAPWSVWTESGASGLELPVRDLIHHTIVVDDRAKTVSSSEAHTRVAESSLFPGRPERAGLRLGLLVAALSAPGASRADWRRAYEIAWSEFWDMHALFETSSPPFGYMSGGSIEAVSYARDALWEKSGDGPIVTMDAGANVHFLFRADQAELADRSAAELGARYRVISSRDWLR